MPLSNGLIWQKRRDGCGNAKFHITFTDEAFPSESEMKKREKEYAECKWICRHLSAEGEKMSLRIALEKEREALLEIRKRVPDDMLAEICRIIHHNFANEITLLESIRSRLKRCFFKGEVVSFTHLERDYEGRIRAYNHGNGVSPSDKENERTYAIEVVSSDCKVVKDVRAVSIKRKLSLSDDELNCLIALLAFKGKGSNKPWIVDDEFREQFNVPNKIHSMFACVSPSQHRSIPTLTVSSSDDSEDEQVVKVRLSSGIAPHSTIATKRRKQLLRNSTKKLNNDKKYTMKDKEGAERTKKRKEEIVGKKGPDGGEPLRKKKKSAASETHQRGLAEFLITTPGNNSPLARMTPSKIGERKLEATVAKLTKELIAQDTKAFHSACAVAAKSLSLSLIKAIPNDILRYAVMKQYNANQDADAMKRMSVEEKKEYKEKKRQERKEEHVKMEKELHALLSKKLEDTIIKHKLAIPELKRMDFRTDDRSDHFLSCLVISEFVNTFKDMLLPDCVPSAEAILNALYNGREGFFEVIGHIVVAFLKLLLQDTTGNKYGGYGVRLRMVPVTLSTASELVRLVLRGNKSLRETEERAPENGDAVAADTERDALTPESSSNEQPQIQQRPFVDKLKKMEFFELSASEQLEALQFLQERVLEADTLDTYLTDARRSEIAKLDAIKKTKEAEIASLKAELDEVDTSSLAAKSPSKMTRKESIDWSRIEKRRQEVIKKIEQKEEDVSVMVNKIQEVIAKCGNICRIKPLGSDRFHRRYWFFGQSPNTGIFVEEHRSLDSSSYLLEVDSKQSPKKKDSRTSNVTGTLKSAQSSKNGQLSHGTPSAADTPKKAPMTLNAFINHQPTFVDETGKSEWFRITDEAVLGKLIAALSEKGYRESCLLSNLTLQMDQIKSSMKSLLVNCVGEMPYKSKSKREEDDEANVMDEYSLLREEIANLESQLRKSLFTSIEDHEVFIGKLQSADSVQLFSEMILELEGSLYDRAVKEKMDDSAKTNFNRDEWRTFMKGGETISRLSVLLCILEKCIDWDQSVVNKKCVSCRRHRNRDDFVVCNECGEATHIYCVRPPLTERPPGGQFICNNCQQKEEEEQENGEEEESEEEPEVGEEVDSSSSDWEEERDDWFRRSRSSRKNRKRKKTRSKMRRAHEYKYFDVYTLVEKNSRASADDGPKTSLQQELQEVFAKVEEDNRIYNSLIAVPAVRRGARINSTISLEDIRKALYSYPSVEGLKKDLLIFIDGALRHFKDNERKLPLLQKLKSDLRL